MKTFKQFQEQMAPLKSINPIDTRTPADKVRDLQLQRRNLTPQENKKV